MQLITHRYEVADLKATDHRSCVDKGFQNQNEKYKCEIVGTTKARSVIEPSRSDNESSRWRRRTKVFVAVMFFVTPNLKL